MLRLESDTGWWLVTHPDHARLAGEIASFWGNDLFVAPEPRSNVLLGICTHDDGWAARDAHPTITKQGKPAAFSAELVGKYSAFEEIDLSDYLDVRECAVTEIASRDAYAALLVSKHTYNLLTARADRSTIAAAQLPLLDDFLDRQRALQQKLLQAVQGDPAFNSGDVSDETIEDHFHLLQACDNMSLLACVNYASPATLLHALPTRDGRHLAVQVAPLGNRSSRLAPYPLRQRDVAIPFPARHVTGKTFTSSEELAERFAAASTVTLTLTLTA